MRAILTIACASVAFAAGAQAQDALRSCRQIRDDGERLKCYDRLDASSSSRTGRPAESKPGAGTSWIVNDEKSPLDDSPLVSAALESSDGKAHLLMRSVAPSPIPLIRAFADQGKIYFRMFDHHNAAYDALFNLGKVSEIRSRLAEACDWEGTAKATENPASKPPTPAASPSPSKAAPK